MGTTLRVSLEAPRRAAGLSVSEEVFGAVRRLESLLSTWRDDAGIAVLNRAMPGRPVRLPAELYGLLREAAEWSGATGGAFDPAIGALVDAWGLRDTGRVPAPDRLAVAREASGLERFGFTDSARTVVRRDSAAWLDTGGFGKGAALREAERVLRGRGIRSAFLNFGGQVLALGGDRGGDDWIVTVAHPARRDEPVLRLRVRDRSVSTSSQSERAVGPEGRRLGHIVDPRTGRPVPAWGSVTVVAADPLVADILSTALLVLGPDEAARWAADRTDIGVLLLVDENGRLRPHWNEALRAHLISQTDLTRGG